jgi:hypothetical protein
MPGSAGPARVVRWDGNTWSRLGPTLTSGLDGPVEALAVSGSTLYVGGEFTKVNSSPFQSGVTANNVSRWNGTSWSPLQSGVDSIVSSLAISGSDLYVGGHFDTASGIPAKGIAKWDGSAWSAIGSGFDGSVSALLVSGSDLYVGGALRLDANQYH